MGHLNVQIKTLAAHLFSNKFFYYNISLLFLSISGNGLWQSNMTAGNIQNSKRISLYGSKQTHGLDWQNHFFPFLSFETIQRRHRSRPESLHKTNEKGPKHVTFSPHLPESRWHPLHFLKSLCTYKRKKKKTLKQQYQFLFPGCGGGGVHFGQRTDEVVHFRKLEKQQKQNQKKLDASALAQKQPHRKLGGGWWVLVRW